ncbi:hypothetical protein IT072_03685 [Leifsonia sp. ZF2019]|uniref:hypothetical protein n=1 Tax=Leifsonia sp. ZF2019 TaxID=2781978 RepID=UPI001CBE6F28|nr:hypothetical protein [Leifsonia sp. ZF2019]UAJ80160.1 hypothetical protein IT072_03685 [Leifsonia sp. ZF2019]
MPREQINHPPTPSSRVPISGAGVPAGFDFAPWMDPAIHVGWHPGSWVQLGLELDISYARFAIASPNGSTPGRTLVWTDVLTSDEIDKLIATLKRAKRKAFGRR